MDCNLVKGHDSRPIVPIWRSDRHFPLPQSEWLRCSGIILSYLKPWMPRWRSKQHYIALLSVFICGMAHAPHDFSFMPLPLSPIFAPYEQSMSYINSFSVPFRIKRILGFKSLSWLLGGRNCGWAHCIVGIDLFLYGNWNIHHSFNLS